MSPAGPPRNPRAMRMAVTSPTISRATSAVTGARRSVESSYSSACTPPAASITSGPTVGLTR